MNELVTQSNISLYEFGTLYPLFAFDVSKHRDNLKISTINIDINAEFTAPIPVHTEAFAVVMSDRVLKFKPDGSKMSVVY